MGRPDDELDYAVAVLRLLADRTRLTILLMLGEREYSVSEMAEALDRPGPAVSQHLARLRAAGLVENRKDGATVYYSQPDARLRRFVTNAVHLAEQALREQAQRADEQARGAGRHSHRPTAGPKPDVNPTARRTRRRERA